MYLTLSDLLLWFGVALVAYFWWHGRGLKDGALQAAKRYCKAQELQLLDESMVLTSLRPARADNGMMCLRRHFRFEFSATGDERYIGRVEMRGSKIQTIQLDPHRMPD